MSSITALLAKAKTRTFSEFALIAFIRGRSRLMAAAYRLRYPGVEFGTGLAIHGKLVVRGRGKVRIGDRAVIHGTLCIESVGEVIVGSDCMFGCFRHQINRLTARVPSARVVIGPHSFFNGAEVSAQTSIEFGPRCIVSDALIEDDDYHSIEVNRWDPAARVKSFPIQVGENVWIGSRAVVLKGVTIGNNSVIGLGTIVRKSVPENCIVIGNPQQIVKQLDPSISPYVLPL